MITETKIMKDKLNLRSHYLKNRNHRQIQLRNLYKISRTLELKVQKSNPINNEHIEIKKLNNIKMILLNYQIDDF